MLEAIALGITEWIMNLDSELIVLQLNRQYSIRNHQILGMYLWVHLLEHDFDFITYHHIPRCMKTLTDELTNYMLDMLGSYNLEDQWSLSICF